MRRLRDDVMDTVIDTLLVAWLALTLLGFAAAGWVMAARMD